MFETVVTAVLNKFLGDYVANLEHKQLNLGIFSGNIVLADLQLKKAALDQLNLPIEVFYGYLGKLELHIPWRSLKTQPVQVIIEDLFLLAGPRVETEYDPVVEEERLQKSKHERLETAELFSSTIDAQQLSQDLHQESFTTQLITKIVDNLQVTIKNIHIRFEDSTSNPERMFAVGVTLKSLSAVSTDADWNDSFIVNPQDAVNKLVKLHSFSVYWNTRDQPVQKLTYEEFVRTARELIDHDDHSYVLRPVSGIGKATLNKHLVEGVPKTLIDVFFDAFALNLNYEQYFDILSTLAAFSTAQRALPYRKFRPAGDSLSSAELFRYAITCYRSQISERNRRRSWQYVLQRRDDRKEYINLYSNKLILGTLTGEDADRLGELERKLEFEDLLQYRSVAKAFAKKSQASTPKGYGTRILGWLGFKESANTELVKEEDIKELYETIDFDAAGQQGTNNALPHAQLFKVNFELGQGSLSLSSDPTTTEPMASLLFTKLLATFIQRPKTMAVDLALKDMVLVENLVPESHFRELIKVKPSLPGSPALDKPLLHVSYDQMTKNPSASAEISLALRPLLMIVNVIAADRLVSFLLNKSTLPLLDALKAEAKQTFDTIGIKTRANMQKALQDHKGTDLSVKIDAPVILLPEDPTNLAKSLFVIDLGKMRAESELVSSEDKQKIFDRKRQLTDEEMDELQHLLFDRITLHLSQFAMYYAENVGAWWTMAGEELVDVSQANKILDQIDLQITLDTSILSTAANLAKIKVSAHVPEIILYMSDRKIEKVMAIINSLPKSSQLESVQAAAPAKAAATTTAPPKTRPRRSTKPKKREPSPIQDQEEFFDAFDDTSVMRREAVEDPVPEDEVDPLNLVLGVTLDKLAVLMSKTEDLTWERAVASFTAQKLDLAVVLHEHVREFGFKIAAFSVMEHVTGGDGSMVIDGAFLANKDLLHASIKLVNPESADFSSLYREIERSVLIDISSVGIFLDPERLYPVAEFIFKDVLPKVSRGEEGVAAAPAAAATAHNESTIEKLKQINTEEILAYQPKTEVAFSFSQFSIFVMERNIKVGVLEADDMQISVLLSGSRLVLSGDFSSFFFRGITELRADAEYKQLFYFIGDSVVKFKFETKCSGSPDRFAGSNVLSLSTGQLCVYLDTPVIAQVVSTGVKFMKIVQLATASSPSSSSTGATPAKSAEDGSSALALDASSFTVATYIDVNLMAPVIFVPSIDGKNVIRVNFGQLLLSNRVMRVEGLSAFDQLIDVDLTDIYIVLLNSELQTERYLLNKFHIPVTLRITADAMKRNYADIEVDSELQPIRLEMNNGDYATMMAIINEILSSINTITNVLPKGEKSAEDGGNGTETEARTRSGDGDKNGEGDKDEEEKARDASPTLSQDKVSASTASQQGEERFLFDAKMVIPSLSLRLNNPQDEPKVTLDINGVSLMAVSHSVRGLGIEVGVESISIRDQEDPDQPYAELFCLGEAAETYNEPLVDAKRQFLVRMDKRPDGSTIANVYIESPRVFVLFDTIFFLQNFFVLESPLAAPATKSSASPASSASPGGAASSSAGSFTLLFNLLDASVLLVQDPKNVITETLAFRVGSLSVKMDQNLGVIIDEVSFFVFNTENPTATKIELIDDFSGVISLSNDPKHHSSRLDVSLQPLSLTISFQDLQLFQCFLTMMSEAQARYGKKRVAAGEVEPHDERTAPPTRNAEKGSISIPSLRALVIDDSGKTLIPLLDFAVENISFQMENWSSQLLASVKATLRSNFYNPALSYWEPLIEPWTVSITMGPSDLEPHAKNVLLISSDDELNILVVHHSLERLLQMVKKLGVTDPKKSKMSRRLSCPYRFTNLVDCAIEIEDVGDVSRRVALRAGETHEFSFQDWKQGRSKAVSSPHRVNVKAPGFKLIPNVSLDRDGYLKLQLEVEREGEGEAEVEVEVEGEGKGKGKGEDEDADEGEPRKIYLQSFLENGVRHLFFRDPVMLVNETSFNLLLMVEGADAGRTFLLEPDQRISIAPLWMKSSFRIVPDDGEHEASQLVEFSAGMRLDGTVLCAAALKAEKPPVNMVVSCCHPSLEAIFNVCIVAPICLENLLPAHCQLQLKQHQFQTVHSLAENQVLSIFGVDPSAAYTIAISIPDLGVFSTNECLIDVNAKEMQVLSMQNEQGLELKVRLSIIRCGASINLSLSPFYLLVNQTNMTIQVLAHAHLKNKKTEQIFTVPPNEDGKPFIMFSHPNPKSVKNRVHIRVADSSWSDALSFETVGAETEFNSKSILAARWYNLSGYVGLGQGKFANTKIVYLSPRYFFVNDTDLDFDVKDSDATVTVPLRSQVPVHFNPADLEGIHCKPSASPEWMAPFDIRNVGKLYLRSLDGENKLFRVGRSIRNPNYFITISATESWPIILQNHTGFEVTFRQKNVEKLYRIAPHSEAKYSWDQPIFTEKRLVLVLESKEHTLDLAEIGRKLHFKVKDGMDKSWTIDLAIKAHGPAVLVELQDRYHSLDVSSKESLQLAEAAAYTENIQNVILLKFSAIAVSLIGRNLEEFLLLYAKGLEVRYAVTEQFVSYGVTLKWMQIDNQCFDWDHPMLLYPAVLSKSQKELEAHPFLSLGVIQSTDKSFGVTYFKYFGLLLQEIAVEVGEELLRRVIDFANLSLLNADPEKIIDEKGFEVAPFAVEKDISEVLFFEFFQIHPIKLNITFSRTEGPVKKEKSAVSYNPLSAMADVITMMVGNISDAPLKFNALVLENILVRQACLQETIIEHYKQEGIAQVHKVLGSADFIGNPVGLVSTLGSGVTDLFYEPYQGFVSDRPQDIGIGFARGGISLVKKTISGLSGTLSKLSGSLAKGLSAATLDSSYQQRRRTGIARNRPKHALSGVSTGALHLYSGVKSGLSGVVGKPLEGAKESGVGGFFRGVGVGLVGAVTKPLVGVFDMTTSLTEGIKSSTDDANESVVQVRFPRVIPWDEKIRPYDMREAFGQSIFLNSIGESSLDEELYVEHIEVPGERTMVIVTTKRILAVAVDKMKIVWQVDLTLVRAAEYTVEYILIHIISTPPRTKIIPIVDEPTQKVPCALVFLRFI